GAMGFTEVVIRNISANQAECLATIERAARLGDGWLGDPGMTYDQAEVRLAKYREACSRYGVKPKAIPIRRDVFVGADMAEAERVMAPYIEGGYRGFDADALVWGDVDHVTRRFDALGAMGFTEVVIRNISANQAECLATIERLGEVREKGTASSSSVSSNIRPTSSTSTTSIPTLRRAGICACRRWARGIRSTTSSAGVDPQPA
ncbi:MAG: LLM class flavin-dependent oxidoreductase, partial [Gammaproteobacteria bacterium]